MAVLQKRRLTLLLFVIASTGIAAFTVLAVPSYYGSKTTVVSANTLLADKGRMFNGNIQHLYSYFGSGDDLDRIVGVGETDASFRKLVQEFSLTGYYHITGDSTIVQEEKAVKELRNDLRFVKNENAQLEIRVWMKDKQLAANIANRMVSLIEETEKGIWRNNYGQSQEKLTTAIAAMEQQYRSLADSLPKPVGAGKELLDTRLQTLLEQIKQYRKTADEYTAAAENIPAALYVLEPAIPAAYAQRPDKPAVIAATAIASFLFGVLLVLTTGDRKNKA